MKSPTLKLMRLINSTDCDQPVHYDLALNRSNFNLYYAVDLICALVEQ
jgi:hypothetical protein